MAGRDLAALLSVEVDALDDSGLLSHLVDLETVERRLTAAKLRADAELDARGIALARGYKKTSPFLRDLLRISPGEAGGRMFAAAAVGPRRALTGEVLEPIYPSIAAAQAEGAISSQHAQVVIAAIEGLPAEVRAVQDRSVEAALVAHARELDPDRLKKAAAVIVANLDPDGIVDTFKEREARRYLRIRPRSDGSSHVEGELTAECTELLLTLRDALGRPRPIDDVPDPRTADQRTHDAVAEGLARLFQSETLPDIAGVKATVVLTMSAEAYATNAGFATTGHGYRIPAQEAKRWATADHDVIAVAVNKMQRIEAHSTTHRIFNRHQRLALWARDRGCTFPGCDAPPGWCETHHVTEHQEGGPTSTDNGVLLCRYHHANYARLDWHCEIRDGVPHWIPPKWLDAAQTPRRNELRT